MTDAAGVAGAARESHRKLFEMGVTLAASLDLDEVLTTIARQICEACGAQSCDINEYDAAANTMTYAAVWAPELREEDVDYLGTVVSLDERPWRAGAIRSGDLVESCLDDPDLDPAERALMEQYGEYAALDAPLIYDGEPIGVLGIVGTERFDEEKRRLLRFLASPAAIAIGNARAYRAQRERARRTGALLDTSWALASLDLDDVLGRVVRLAVELAGAARAAVSEYRHERDTLVERSVFDKRPRFAASSTGALLAERALREHSAERGILTGTLMIEAHLGDEQLPADRRAQMLLLGGQTCLSVPLRFDDEPVGILHLFCEEPDRHFLEDELELLAALGELAATAIHNAGLFREQREHSERLLGLFDASRSLASTFDPATIVTAVERGARRLFGAGPVVTVLLPGGDGSLRVDGLGIMNVPVVALVREAEVAGRTVQRAGDEWAALVVPITVRERLEGAVLVQAAGRRAFGMREVETMEVLANQAGVAFANAHLYRRLAEQSITDGLTGLRNHRYFYERLSQEWARALRYGLPLSLLMIDIDDFKHLNDRHGHQRGDEVLRCVGGVLRDGTRRGVDLPARYGGEEFAVILPHTVLAGAGVVGGRLRQRVGDLSGAPERLPPPGPAAVLVGERLRRDVEAATIIGARATVSVGAATAEEAADLEELVRRADKAMYRAKRAGKNRVELYE